jgi:hypothetical protein
MERRASPRKPITLIFPLYCSRNLLGHCTATNMSRHGVFVETGSLRLTMSAIIDLVFVLRALRWKHLLRPESSLTCL